MWCVCSSLEINAVVAGRLVNFQPGFLGQLRAPATYSLQPPARNRVPCAAAPRKVASAANATVRITVPRGSERLPSLGCSSLLAKPSPSAVRRVVQRDGLLASTRTAGDALAAPAGPGS